MQGLNPNPNGAVEDGGRRFLADQREALDEIDVRRTQQAVRAKLFGTPAEPVSLGRFRIEGLLGRGAMGRVYVAYDPRLERRVALKMIRAGDGPASHRDQRQQHLLEEARALAKVAHPNVVPVHEVGEIDGEVFVAMELVEGTNLRTWSSNGERTWREVLDVFVQAVEGLEATHAQGLVHRDFKPDNVLIGDDGRARVADFGLANALACDVPTSDAEPVDDRGLTLDGAVVGSPAYMAPEVTGGGVATPHSDQYSVGVSLYEALYGHRPSEIRPRQRRPQAVPRWLDRVIQRAMAPQPTQRFRGMSELRSALERDPARRWRRAGVAGAVVAAVTYAAWPAEPQAPSQCSGARAQLQGVWDAAVRRRVESAMKASRLPYADSSWARVSSQLDEFADDWVSQHTSTCEATVRGEQSPEALDHRMGCLRRAKHELAASVRQLAHADAGTMQRAHRFVDELPRLARCEDVEALQTQVPAPHQQVAAAVEEVREQMAAVRAEQRAGHYQAAVTMVESLESQLDALGYEPLRTELWLVAGSLQGMVGHHDDAVAILDRALQSGLAWRQWKASRTAASQLCYFAGLQQGRPQAGLAYGVTARGLLGHTPDPEAEADVRRNIALVLHAQGQSAEAEAELRAVLSIRRAVLEPDHSDIAQSHNDLGSVLAPQGRYADAELEFRAAHAQWSRVLGSSHPLVATAHNNIGAALMQRGEFSQAEEEFRAATTIWTALLEPGHPDFVGLHNNIAVVLKLQQQYAQAEAEYRTALSLGIAAFGAEHPRVVSIRNNLGIVLEIEGKLEEAEAEYRAVLSARLKVLGAEHLDVATSRLHLASALHELDRDDEARAESLAALKIRTAILGPDHPDVRSLREGH